MASKSFASILRTDAPRRLQFSRRCVRGVCAACLIEGGAHTVSTFLTAGCLDRLHIVTAPMLLGAGQPSIELPPVERADEALRPPVRAHLLADEVLFDVDLSAQRVSVGTAKTSV